MKQGDIIQNYQGNFAKIVSIKDGRFGLTAWVSKRSEAEKETKAVRFLNKYGLAQVLPEKAPDADANDKRAEEEALALKQKQEEEAEATRLAELKAQEEAEAAGLVDHTITQADLDLNPDLVEEGVKVGDIVKLPKAALDEEKKEGKGFLASIFKAAQ